jgi:hypothetical protein
VSWNLKGSYFETCSCDLMCPCNLSFDHGATYDYCLLLITAPDTIPALTIPGSGSMSPMDEMSP